MQAAIVFTMLLGATMAATMFERSENVPVVRASDYRDNQGGYRYGFESANGIVQEESGSLKNVGTEELANVKTGKVSWTSPEGIPFTLSYTADETGFHPTGDHLPTPPPIPQAILESLALIRTAGNAPEAVAAAPSYAVPSSFVAVNAAVPHSYIAVNAPAPMYAVRTPTVNVEVRKPFGGY